MTNAKKIATTKPANDRPAAPRRGRGIAPEAPAASGQTATREGESSHAAPARTPSKSTDRGNGSPAPSPASSARSTLVRFPLAGPSPVALAVVRAVFGLLTGAEIDALAVDLLALVKVADVAAWVRVVDAIEAAPHAAHARAVLGALGASPDNFHGRPDGFTDDLFMVVCLVRDEWQRRHKPDLDGVLRDVAKQVERDCNGSLAIGLCTAQRVARGELLPHEVEEGDDALANDLAFLMVDLRRDLRHAAARFHDSYSVLAAARRNDGDDVIARRVDALRYDRRELVRVATLIGRVAAAAEGAGAAR